MNKKVKEAILDIMADAPNISKDEVIELIKTYDDVLDIQALVNKEYKAKATRLMATFRDDKGVRDVFTIKNENDLAEYVDVTRSNKVNDLMKVKATLVKNIRGNTISLEKIETRLVLVGGQQSIFDLAIKE